MKYLALLLLLSSSLTAQGNDSSICNILKEPSGNLGKVISIEGKYVFGLESHYVIAKNCDVIVYLGISQEVLAKSKELAKKKDTATPSFLLLGRAFADTFQGVKGLKKTVFASLTGVLSCGNQSSRELSCEAGKEALMTITSVDRVRIEVSLEY